MGRIQLPVAGTAARFFDMAKVGQDWYESDDDSLPSLPPSLEYPIVEINKNITQVNCHTDLLNGKDQRGLA